MSKKHMIKDFTPALDTIVENHDVLTAVVYGRVWRYCQMESGKCFASQEKLADDLGVSIKTIERRLKLLVKRDYLIDLTPDRKNKPHEYMPTGKAGIKLEASAFDTTESRTGTSESRSTTTESPPGYDLESVEESSKKQNNKPNKKDKGNSPELIYEDLDPKPKRMPRKIQRPLVDAISKVTGLDLKIKSNYSYLSKYAKGLWEGGYTPEDVINTFGVKGSWYKIDWRGKNGELPTPADITKTIKNYMAKERDPEAERRKYVEGEYSEFIDH